VLPVATAEVARLLRGRLQIEQPRLLAAWHVLTTGLGECLVDRWPSPRAFLAVAESNQALVGEPEALEAEELHGVLDGFVEAPDEFAPLLRAIPDVIEWPRVNFVQAARQPIATTIRVRRLGSADTRHVENLSPQSRWIANTWGSPANLAESGMAYGAFVGGRLASLACSFLVAARYEDIGVVTEPEFRGRGLSPACAARLCAAIHRRRRVPSWTTSPDNTASIRVAEKLGFELHHRDRLWVFGRAVPRPTVYP
jgi:RimJ/RimL family protein N-acetyltransferase